MRTLLDNQAITNHLSTLQTLQTKLKATQLASLSTAEMLKLVSELATINGQIKAFNAILNNQL